MRELSDQQFDADAARKLKFSILVTLSQQQLAKDRLLRSAAYQTILPALAPEECVSLRETLRLQVVHLLNVLIFDSRAYERAHYPRFGQFYSLHGRYAFLQLYA